MKSDDVVKKAIRDFQEFAGLNLTGEETNLDLCLFKLQFLY